MMITVPARRSLTSAVVLALRLLGTISIGAQSLPRSSNSGDGLSSGSRAAIRSPLRASHARWNTCPPDGGAAIRCHAWSASPRLHTSLYVASTTRPRVGSEGDAIGLHGG